VRTAERIIGQKERNLSKPPFFGVIAVFQNSCRPFENASAAHNRGIFTRSVKYLEQAKTPENREVLRESSMLIVFAGFRVREVKNMLRCIADKEKAKISQ
jgi:hypothetical protein